MMLIAARDTHTHTLNEFIVIHVKQIVFQFCRDYFLVCFVFLFSFSYFPFYFNYTMLLVLLLLLLLLPCNFFLLLYMSRLLLMAEKDLIKTHCKCIPSFRLFNLWTVILLLFVSDNVASRRCSFDNI